MSTEISPDNERFVEQEVANGTYANRNQALDDAVELLKQRKEFLRRITESRRQLDEGEYTDYDDESMQDRFDELKQRTRNLAGINSELPNLQ